MYALRILGKNTCFSCIPVLFQILVKAWEVGVFAPACESQLNLAALWYMENHVWSHMEKKLIQFYRIVQFNVFHRGIQALHNNLRKRKWNSKGYTKSHTYNSSVDPHSFWLAYLKSNTKLLGLPGMRTLKHRDICTYKREMNAGNMAHLLYNSSSLGKRTNSWWWVTVGTAQHPVTIPADSTYVGWQGSGRE